MLVNSLFVKYSGWLRYRAVKYLARVQVKKALFARLVVAQEVDCQGVLGQTYMTLLLANIPDKTTHRLVKVCYPVKKERSREMSVQRVNQRRNQW